MTQIQPYVFPTTGQQLRTLLLDGEPWFVAADACRVLDIDVTVAMRRLDDDEYRQVPATLFSAQGPARNVVSESGLYSLILGSRKPEAKAFKRWITHEVLPAIRRTGRYEVAEVSRRQLAQMVIEAETERERAEEERDEARAHLALAAPRAEAYTAFMDADGTYSMESVAKMLLAETGLGRNRLFRKLRELNVLQDNNLPYQRYAHHFHVVASSFEHSDGRRQTTYSTRVRASGVEFIRRKLGCAQTTLVAVDEI